MADTFTVEELAVYPGVAASPETLALVAGLINELVAEKMAEYAVVAAAKPIKLKTLALAAAARQLTNPLGATTMQFQIDDYKETIVLPDGSVVKGSTGIGFTPDEMGRVVVAITGIQPDRGSIRLPVPGYTDCEQDYQLVGWLPS